MVGTEGEQYGTGQPGPLWVVVAGQPLVGWDCNHRPQVRPSISTYSRPTRVYIVAATSCTCLTYNTGYMLLHGGPFWSKGECEGGGPRGPSSSCARPYSSEPVLDAHILASLVSMIPAHRGVAAIDGRPRYTIVADRPESAYQCTAKSSKGHTYTSLHFS